MELYNLIKEIAVDMLLIYKSRLICGLQKWKMIIMHII